MSDPPLSGPPNSNWVIDVSDADFVAAVVERSREVPVVVDFWAPWCGPCRNLGPILEGLAAEYAGAFVLAKVDIDQSPAVAQQLQIKSIPLVIAFRDGGAISEFSGAQPEPAVRQFLEAILPSGADRKAQEGNEAAAMGDTEAAEAAYSSALAEDPRHPLALLGMARLLGNRGDPKGGLEFLARMGMAPRGLEHEAERLAAELRTAATPVDTSDLGPLRDAAEARPDDLQAGLDYARALVASRAYSEALPLLISLVERDKAFADEAARKTILDVFELLGSGHDLTKEYRAKLAAALFR